LPELKNQPRLAGFFYANRGEGCLLMSSYWVQKGLNKLYFGIDKNLKSNVMKKYFLSIVLLLALTGMAMASGFTGRNHHPPHPRHHRPHHHRR